MIENRPQNEATLPDNWQWAFMAIPGFGDALAEINLGQREDVLAIPDMIQFRRLTKIVVVIDQQTKKPQVNLMQWAPYVLGVIAPDAVQVMPRTSLIGIALAGDDAVIEASKCWSIKPSRIAPVSEFEAARMLSRNGPIAPR